MRRAELCKTLTQSSVWVNAVCFGGPTYLYDKLAAHGPGEVTIPVSSNGKCAETADDIALVPGLERDPFALIGRD